MCLNILKKYMGRNIFEAILWISLKEFLPKCSSRISYRNISWKKNHWGVSLEWFLILKSFPWSVQNWKTWIISLDFAMTTLVTLWQRWKRNESTHSKKKKTVARKECDFLSLGKHESEWYAKVFFILKVQSLPCAITGEHICYHTKQSIMAARRREGAFRFADTIQQNEELPPPGSHHWTLMKLYLETWLMLKYFSRWLYA